MLDWLKKLLPAGPPPAAEPPPTAEEALTRLQTLASDAMIEEVWDGMDLHASELESVVKQRLIEGTLGRYPSHAATIWLAYQRGNREELADDVVVDRLEDSVVWALGFEENNVLIGGALGALDALEPSRREAMALRVFEAMGDDSARRFWLLLKVRTDAMMQVVADALEAYRPELRPKMAGVFRQFRPEDVDLLLRYYDPQSAGAAMFVEAFGAVRSEAARDVLEEATADERSEVAEAARRGLRKLAGER